MVASDELGPLHGVPMTVKENLDLVGTPTTSGMAILAEAMPTMDAPVVERMRAAGAIPIGRTNLPEMGLRMTTDNPLRGLTRNPWHPDITAGGSSGGEASAHLQWNVSYWHWQRHRWLTAQPCVLLWNHLTKANPGPGPVRHLNRTVGSVTGFKHDVDLRANGPDGG